MKGFVIAGTGSGSGKTTLSLGILAWLSGKGYRVAPFKVGPDFIDPGHHTALTGRVSRNLDSWMLSRQTNEAIFARGCENADIAVVEGVMGLFDGYSGTSEAGSTAQMAKLLNLPVILIVDARSMARSAAAIVQGFENFDHDLNFAGVIFNKTGSSRHYEYLKSAVESTCKMPCIGHIKRNDAIVMPERHLGLVTSEDHTISPDTVATMTRMIDLDTRLEKIISVLPDIKVTSSNASTAESQKYATSTNLSMSSVKIAVARDRAFCFYYRENLEALEQNGAELIEFSPMRSESLPPDICGIYFGGGYPELFAETLSANRKLMAEIRQASLNEMPIYGECGGFMYLCRDITSMDGTTKWPMTGCFSFSAVMSKKMRSLGYRKVSLKQDTLIGKSGDILKGHEFHYSSLETEETNKTGLPCKICKADVMKKIEDTPPAIDNPQSIKKVYYTYGRDGQNVNVEGYQIGHTLGSYLHVHFGSSDGAAASFVSACRKWSEV
ncbi:Cobyrinic acid A,C-diamide synthase [Desulfamplus magnetovallimortis]|uniref:Cobyrinate a,c-diamide synthase n=1 Tax=Desulfamplus magnetovallimortis TaxID=1246637 RepID=A0A1W1HAE0_9BACT|nr:cobyrinate a,c-diamide synthase [Desulfamplus magnetovallimortis]SLM29338.1 Cobyrinic acid A,C-diamide synthase [Desulfamplus magnetovallimortis]